MEGDGHEQWVRKGVAAKANVARGLGGDDDRCDRCGG